MASGGRSCGNHGHGQGVALPAAGQDDAFLEAGRPAWGEEYMEHLTGARAVLALWIVCHHAFTEEEPSVISALTMRVNVAVEAFVLLSGFITQHTYGQEKPKQFSFVSILSFYMRRLGRILFATEVAMLLVYLQHWISGDDYPPLKAVGCFLFIEPWFNPLPDCPNMPTWFVASILPSWLLYPLLTQRVLNSCQQRAVGVLLALGLALWLLCIGPMFSVLAYNGSWLTFQQVTLTWFWPGALLPDFALGACLSALVRKLPPRRWHGHLADTAAVSLLLVCLFAPVPPETDIGAPSTWTSRPYTHWEPFAGKLAAPLLCLFLYGSAGGGSRTARLFSHPALVALGAYSMEVYLLQTPVHNVFLMIRAPSSFWKGMPWTTEVFTGFLVLLWLVSGLFAEFLAEPVRRRVKEFAVEWERQRSHEIAAYSDMSRTSHRDVNENGC